MERKKEKLFWNNLLILCLTIFIIGMATTYYLKKVQYKTEEEIGRYLNEVAMQSAMLVKEKIQNDQVILESVAEFIKKRNGSIFDPSILESLKEMEKNGDFEKIAIVDVDGWLRHIDFVEPVNVKNAEHFKLAMAGKTNISKVVRIQNMQKEAIIMSVPIFQKGEIVGVLMGRYEADSFGELITITSFDGEGCNYIADSRGNVFAVANNKNADPDFKSMKTGFYDTKLENENDLEKALENLEKGRQGEIWYTWNGTQKIMSYIPIGIEDWFLLSVVPVQFISSKSVYLFQHAFILCITICSFLICISVYTIQMNRRRREELKWANMQHNLDKERYSIIMEQIKDIVFEWDMVTKRIYYSKFFYQKFGYEPEKENFPESVVEKGSIESHHVSAFLSIFQKIKEGEKYSVGEVQIQNKEGAWIWCKFRVTAIWDEHQKPYKAIGLISDIDEQKRENEKIEEAANRDFLTGFYNKGITEKKIQNYLEQEEKKQGVLFVIDIDDFKNINDTMGHIFGDCAINKLSTNLKTLFRDSDILGRIGGDEFVVFIPDISSNFNLRAKAEKVTKMMNYSFYGDKNCHWISASIGISRYPEDASSYSELFDKADIALYYAKRHGKNQYAIYQEQFREEIFSDTSQREEIVDLKEQSPWKKNI